jgi:hypothetical protein
MSAQIRDSDVNTVCIRFMNKLIQKIQKDEKVRIYKDPLYQEACTDSADGLGDYDYNNLNLKNRVFQELFKRGDITQGDSADQIKITCQGKNRPEYHKRNS